jgi:XRE family transcriptional regulator, fatty acid utilization regulator
LEYHHRLKVQFDQEFAEDRPIRMLDREAGLICIDGLADKPSQIFALAHQLALLEFGGIIDNVIAQAGFQSSGAGAVCRLALANYFAGALMLPYDAFLETALNVRHDVGLLAARFGASREQVCHRLSTLQRPGNTGVPFYFLRVDRAGNITKRHSATRFQFARYGGACPLWNVHEAFETPDRMLVQIADMPDNVRYLSLAFCVTKTSATYTSIRRRYALGLGCEISYADQVVYADGLDFKSNRDVTPIGISCRMCERPNCAQRAFPPVGRNILVNPDRRDIVPYTISFPE